LVAVLLDSLCRDELLRVTHDEAPLSGDHSAEDLRQVIGEARFHDECCTADIACPQTVRAVRTNRASQQYAG
jgi:hypothetical protein